jgi:hypothetical protein
MHYNLKNTSLKLLSGMALATLVACNSGNSSVANSAKLSGVAANSPKSELINDAPIAVKDINCNINRDGTTTPFNLTIDPQRQRVYAICLDTTVSTISFVTLQTYQVNSQNGNLHLIQELNFPGSRSQSLPQLIINSTGKVAYFLRTDKLENDFVDVYSIESSGLSLVQSQDVLFSPGIQAYSSGMDLNAEGNYLYLTQMFNKELVRFPV